MVTPQIMKSSLEVQSELGSGYLTLLLSLQVVKKRLSLGFQTGYTLKRKG